MAGEVPPGEKAWRAFETHQVGCVVCRDLSRFKKLEPVETNGEALPPELCARGRKLLGFWLEGATA